MRTGGRVRGTVFQPGINAVTHHNGDIASPPLANVVTTKVLALLTDLSAGKLVLVNHIITSLHHYTSLDAKCNPLFFEVTIYTLYNIK